jgi:hypothetical protein
VKERTSLRSRKAKDWKKREESGTYTQCMGISIAMQTKKRAAQPEVSLHTLARTSESNHEKEDFEEDFDEVEELEVEELEVEELEVVFFCSVLDI